MRPYEFLMSVIAELKRDPMVYAGAVAVFSGLSVYMALRRVAGWVASVWMVFSIGVAVYHGLWTYCSAQPHTRGDVPLWCPGLLTSRQEIKQLVTITIDFGIDVLFYLRNHTLAP